MISTKGRYALRMIIDIAEHDGEGYVTMKDIAERQGISRKYLESIGKELVNGNLLIGTRGRGGGYKLSKKPEEYNVGEILECMEGSLAPVACLEEDASECPRAATCKTLPLWEEYNSMTHDFFYGRNLTDLM
ncbi:MAG: Rrf2 family transcriptional regulator [Eggerthellaceae bacterium]|nr:Rrf2 family transcriptional regulator [Eggerthellaceae bacterium]